MSFMNRLLKKNYLFKLIYLIYLSFDEYWFDKAKEQNLLAIELITN